MSSKSGAESGAKSGVDWPDWTGRAAVVVGTGPSAAAATLIEVRGRARCIAIKSTWRLAPWADVLYGCDKSWWIEHRGVPKFNGLKVCASPTVCKVYRDIRLVRLKARADILTKEMGTIGCGLRTGGGHSGFQAINLAVQFGATRIVLVGFDMTLARGSHWRADRADAKPDAKRVESWRIALDGCAEQFKALGVEVINATPGSALKNYPKMDLLAAVGDG